MLAVLHRACRRSLSSSISVVLLVSKDRRLRARRLVLKVPSTTFAVPKFSKGSRLSRLVSSRNSKISAISKDPRRSRCSSSSLLSLKARWVRRLFRLLVALVLPLHMQETHLTPDRQSLKPSK